MIRAHLSRRERRRATREEQVRTGRRLWNRYTSLKEIEKAGREVRDLEEPVFLGWERYFVVRPDLRHSPEGRYLERILVLIQRTEPCSQDGVFKERDHYRGRKMRKVPHSARTVDPQVYNVMTPKMKRYFIAHTVRHKYGWPPRERIDLYYALVHPWKFKTKVRERWRTEEIVYTVNVDEEEKLLHEKLFGPRDLSYWDFAEVSSGDHSWDRRSYTDDHRVPQVEPEDRLEVPIFLTALGE